MAAGIWGSGSGIGDSNQALVTKSIEFALHTSLKNRGIIASPVMQQILMQDEALGNLLGAVGASISLADIGQGKAAATAEGTQAAATNFDEASVTLTPARYEYVRTISDYGRSLSSQLLSGVLAPDVLATMVFEGFSVWGNTLVDTIVALASSATYSSGTTGVDYTWQALHHLSIDMVDRGDSGPVDVLLTAKGVKDLADDAMSLGGAVQMAQQVQQFLNVGASAQGGAAFVGNFLGRFSIYMCSELDTSGGDTLGIAFSANGIHTKHQFVPLPAEADTLVDAGMFRMELRRPGGAVSNVCTDMYLAAGIKQQPGLAKILYVTT